MASYGFLSFYQKITRHPAIYKKWRMHKEIKQTSFIRQKEAFYSNTVYHAQTGLKNSPPTVKICITDYFVFIVT